MGHVLYILIQPFFVFFGVYKTNCPHYPHTIDPYTPLRLSRSRTISALHQHATQSNHYPQEQNKIRIFFNLFVKDVFSE